MRPSACPSVRSSCFYINLNISFIYKDIFTKFAGNVYGYENLSVQTFGFILKNEMATIANCLKIIKALNLEIFQLVLSNLHKSDMARKASLIVILASFKKQNGRHITCLMSNEVILLKWPYISPNIAPRGSECENNL